MHILDQLWYGNVDPTEHRYYDRREHKKLLDALIRYDEAVRSELSEEGKAAFLKYNDTDGTLRCISECSTFIEGFRMGALMMLDVLAPNAGSDAGKI